MKTEERVRPDVQVWLDRCHLALARGLDAVKDMADWGQQRLSLDLSADDDREPECHA